MNRVKELRERLSLKQIDLANKLMVSQGTLSNWERGVHDPDNEQLIKMANIFNVSVDYLLGKSNNLHEENLNAANEDEFWELRQAMAERPEMKTLFDLAKTATTKDLEFANDMLKRFKGESRR